MKTYTFHVAIPGTGHVWRKLELRANQTLEDLHLAIQGAFKFDNDHLYSFYMSGRAWDKQSEYTVPQSDGLSPAKVRLTLTSMFSEAKDGRLEDVLASVFPDPGDVRVTKLEDLKLKKGQKFLYLFDYGDEWRFRVTVYAINPDAPAGKYPRVVETVGKPPAQYLKRRPHAPLEDE